MTEPIDATPKSPGENRTGTVLYVDDEPNMLDAFRRQFRKKFTLDTALGAEEGIQRIEQHGPFAVVISDLRMPGMNGLQFLSAVHARCPDSVLIILTGQTAMADAISALNQGAVFRFLLKPSSSTVLAKVIEAGLEQYRLITAERQLTRQTLLGCVEVLAEMLSILEPALFSRAMRIRNSVRQLAEALGVADSWQVEAAAMLSQVGLMTIPSGLAGKASSAGDLSTDERRDLKAHAAAAARVLERIPRLEQVAQMVEYQSADAFGPGAGSTACLSDNVAMGARILRTAIDIDDLRERGVAPAEAIRRMRSQPTAYDPTVVAAMARIESAEESRIVAFDDLAPGMIVEEDIRTVNGVLLIGREQEITTMVWQRLAGFGQLVSPHKTHKVRVPILKGGIQRRPAV